MFVVQPSGNWGGDIDGDGNPDPIFQSSAGRVTMDLWQMRVDQAGNTHVVRCQTSVCLRN